ncbi:hypothetical protein [Dubosiella newyorkensis]|uniref:hypothetical protein n=1 Tax=Dubosiella newyorkensis TaxID=1862672 RepID=UPI00272C8388|nr:hypothetical protein [Dubosiella newyorkensis]
MMKQLFASVLLGGLSAINTPEITLNKVHDPIYEQANLRFEKYFFEPTQETAYLIEDAKGKDIPEESGIDQISFSKYDAVELSGINNYDYWKVEVDGKTYYLEQDSITLDEEVIQDMKEQEEAKRKAEEAERQAQEEAKRQEQLKTNWNGPVLSPSAGTIVGPSGKETYYNLPMEGVVSIMRGMGNNDPYWVREDGVKMLGDYVMVAAHLGLHPRGSIVDSSLGKAIVCDTEGFAHSNPNQLDIATAW